MRPTHALPFIGLAAVASLALAADAFNIKPGLYHMSTTLAMGGSKPVISEDDDCVTEKDIQEARLFKGIESEGQSCKQGNLKLTASTLAGTIECTGGGMSSHTEINFVASSPMAFKGTIKATVTTPNGKTTMDATISATWKSASCPKGRHDD
jgi:hypothetical protein